MQHSLFSTLLTRIGLRRPDVVIPDYAPPSDPMLSLTLGGYRITALLGSGGYATVYKAVADDQEVAIKVVRPEMVSPEFNERFEREIQISAALDHPNVLRTLDYGQQDGLAYMIMELVDGQPLSKLIPPDGLDVASAMPYLAGVIEGLAYAHSLGIVHRDLKPENVMVVRDGTVKLMDFGLARNQDVRTLTTFGDSVGTAKSIAPEQLLRAPDRSGLTDRSDQYSLGILIFEVLTGRPPFDWDDPVKLITMHLSQAPPPITSFRADVPPAIEAVLNRMLCKEPDGRYASVREAGAALLGSG